VYTNDVLKYCKSHGYSITRVGLYLAGKKYNFIFKVEGRKEYVFDKDKFLEWFEKTMEKAPEGYITVSQMRSKYNLPLNKAYAIAKNKKVDARRIGPGKGIIYVDSRKVEEVINEYKSRRVYKWEK